METPRTDAWSSLSSQLERELAQLRAELEQAKERTCHHGWRGSVPEDGKRIVTPCPACGAQSLFIGSGGHLTCARVPTDHSNGCDNPSVERVVNDLKARAESAESRLREAHADAERYRWLRDSAWVDDQGWLHLGNDMTAHQSPNRAEVNAAIDAARAAEGEKK